jgi:hypothetical protein
MRVWGERTSPISAVISSGLNLWSARPTWTVCVCAGAELVKLELGELDMVDCVSRLRAFDVAEASPLDALSCARHTADRRIEFNKKSSM